MPGSQQHNQCRHHNRKYIHIISSKHLGQRVTIVNQQLLEGSIGKVEL
jgi:hypothetical protein